MVIECALL